MKFSTAVPIFFLSSLKCIVLADFESRIVGGNEANPGEFKFMASWHNNFNEEPNCGGSLVAPNLILTAAHCKKTKGGVRVGSVNANGFYYGNNAPRGVEANVSKKIIHPKYNNKKGANDLMLLQLDRDIDTNIYPPIELNFDAQQPKTGDALTVIGFGRLSEGGNSPDRLMKVNVPVVSHNTCKKQYGYIKEDIHLCAGYPQGGKDSCQGDSGGPIFEKIGGVTKQVGVVSFGRGCAQAGYSGVYARLSGAEGWLKTEICNRSSYPKPSFCDGGGGGGGGGSDPSPKEIFYEDFEGDEYKFSSKKVLPGISKDGGDYSIRIRKKQKIESNQQQIQQGYSQMKVTFYAYAKDLESGDSFSVEFNFNGSKNWQEKGGWSVGNGLQEKKWVQLQTSITVPSNTNAVQLRFVGSLDSKKDAIYIDNVSLRAS